MQNFNLLRWLATEHGVKPQRNLAKYLIENWNVAEVLGANIPEEPPPAHTTLCAYAKSSDWPRIRLLLESYAKTINRRLRFADIDNRFHNEFPDLQRLYPAPSVERSGEREDEHAKSSTLPSALRREARVYLYGYCVASEILAQEHERDGAADTTGHGHGSNYVMGYFILRNGPDDMKIEKAEAFYQPKDGCSFSHRRGTWVSDYTGTGPGDLLFVYQFEYDSPSARKPYIGLVAAKQRAGGPICGTGPTYEGYLYVLERFDGMRSNVQTVRDGKIYIGLFNSYDPKSFARDDEVDALKSAMCENYKKWHLDADSI